MDASNLSLVVTPPEQPASVWRERWLSFRNRLLASSRFQRWAAAFPLTRPIARKRAGAVFDLVAGFVYSQILSACIQLKLFDLLSNGPLSVAVLGQRLALSPDAATRLLRAAAALDLIEGLPDGRYALGQLGAALQGNPSLVAMIGHHAMLYADLADPVALLRGDVENPQLKSFWAYAKNPDAAAASPEHVRAYSALMAELQSLIAGDLLDAYPFGRHSKLLDIGGGEGVFLSAVGARHPGLGLVLFDLPAVAQRAKARFAKSGLAARASAVGGDFFRDPLPPGADVASLICVLHDHDDAFALALLQKARSALRTGGRLLVAEPMSGTPGAPAGDAYFGFYLAAMGSGRPRTIDEIGELLRQAGFSRSHEVVTRMPMLVRVLVATA